MATRRAIFEGVYSPWRNTTDMALNKDVSVGGSRRISLRLDVINVFNNPWYQALGSSAHGNTQLRPRHRAGELLADDAGHGEVQFLKLTS